MSSAPAPTPNSLSQVTKYGEIELFHKILDTKNGQIGLRDILTTLQGKGTGHRHTPGFPRKAEIIAEILRLQALS